MHSRAPGRIAAPLRVEVTDALRRDIVTATFEPGDRLVEAALCQKFDVSRTVIREALRQLESEGLVTSVAHRGPVVATLTLQDAADLYEVRQSLESLAGSLFAERATDAERRNLLERLDEIRRAMGQDDAVERLRAKDQFYEALLEGSKNDEIGRMLSIVHARTQMLRVYSLSAEDRTSKTVEEITRITEAAVSGNAEETRRACVSHVQNAAKAALSEMKRRVANLPERFE